MVLTVDVVYLISRYHHLNIFWSTDLRPEVIFVYQFPWLKFQTICDLRDVTKREYCVTITKMQKDCVMGKKRMCDKPNNLTHLSSVLFSVHRVFRSHRVT